jgi:hypothetical protein
MNASPVLRPLAALLAAAAVAAPAAAARPFHARPPASASIASRDVRDLRAAAPTSSLAGTTQAPARPGTSGAGIDAVPLAGGIAAVAAAFGIGAGVTLRRRQARPAV